MVLLHQGQWANPKGLMGQNTQQRAYIWRISWYVSNVSLGGFQNNSPKNDVYKMNNKLYIV